MQHRFDFDTDRGRVVITVAGRLSIDAVRAYQIALYDDPRWRPGMDALADMREVEVGDFNSAQIRTVAGAHWVDPAVRGDGRVATVAIEDVLYGLVRMWGSYIAADDRVGIRSRVFRSYPEAEAWLDETSEAAPTLVDALHPEPHLRTDTAGKQQIGDSRRWST